MIQKYRSETIKAEASPEWTHWAPPESDGISQELSRPCTSEGDPAVWSLIWGHFDQASYLLSTCYSQCWESLPVCSRERGLGKVPQLAIRTK